MEFGRVDNLEAVDFTLPADHPATAGVLHTARKSNSQVPKVYVGCAKWGRKEWVGKIYPTGTQEKDYLKYYVKSYNSIELNAVHYRIPPASWLIRWKSLAGRDFHFCPKIYQQISHIRRLRNAERITEIFLERMSLLEKNLGMIFLQLPPNFSPREFPNLASYLRALPLHRFSFAVEFRHPDWFKPSAIHEETFHLLTELGISAVITDAAGRRDVLHQRLTTPVAFIRFVGNSLHPSDYSRLDAWVERCRDWLQQGLQVVYFFLHHHDERYSPELSAYLVRRMNAVCKLHLKQPIWVGKPEGKI
ncbi:MAG: hypothetical protein KatS3mg031_0885 [Chitinophagales bacterium]|nr:MAG: hypothetical protein KatS3mg031_0885 [Chitinophagales bacterium]